MGLGGSTIGWKAVGQGVRLNRSDQGVMQMVPAILRVAEVHFEENFRS